MEVRVFSGAPLRLRQLDATIWVIIMNSKNNLSSKKALKFQSLPKKFRSFSSGFTIVELLIVIIVIAILATLIITVYNGVQVKAKNQKTVSAVQAWIKAIDLYHEDNGTWPSGISCIGDTNTYEANSKYSDDECWTSFSLKVQSSFVSAVSPYLGQGDVPKPDTTDIGTQRGALYIGFGTPEVVFAQTKVSSCPHIGGLYNMNSSSDSSGMSCWGYLSP